MGNRNTISEANTMQDFFKESAKKYNVKEDKKIARKVRNKTPLVAQFVAACARFNIPSEKTISKAMRNSITAEIVNTKDNVKSDLSPTITAYKIAKGTLGASTKYANIINFAFLKYKQGNTSISQLQSEAMLSEEQLFHFTELL